MPLSLIEEKRIGAIETNAERLREEKKRDAK
jgi:hypothetical protein